MHQVSVRRLRAIAGVVVLATIALVLEAGRRWGEGG
jgi:hypothetical protein